MSYEKESLREFVKSRIGERDYDRMWPVVDRLVTLLQEYKKLSGWLEANEDLLGQKEYKEYTAGLNGLMANILKLEDKIDLYRVRNVSDDDNDVLAGLMGDSTGTPNDNPSVGVSDAS